MPPLDLDLVPALARAADDDSLVLHFQPEVELSTGAVVGMEALLRWQHPARGLLAPQHFLPLAEATGLATKIGYWVLTRCAEEVAAWRHLPGPPPRQPRQLWCNVGGTLLGDSEFVARVSDIVSRAQLPPGALGMEVTEETLVTGGARALNILFALRDIGVALAVDDFGTWYSSMSTIGELPVDAVKLDQSFVRGVGSDLEDDDIVASVIRLAHSHDLYVVAEGVESWSEGARLCELGCDRGFGFLFSGPQTADRARWMLMRGLGWRSSYAEDMATGIATSLSTSRPAGAEPITP